MPDWNAYQSELSKTIPQFGSCLRTPSRDTKRFPLLVPQTLTSAKKPANSSPLLSRSPPAAMVASPSTLTRSSRLELPKKKLPKPSASPWP